MSSHLLNSVDFLRQLISIKNKKQLKFFLEALSKSETLALVEIVINVLDGTVPLTKSEIQSLQKNKAFFRKLKNHNSLSWKEAKKLIIKSLSPVAAIVSLVTFVSNYIDFNI